MSLNESEAQLPWAMPILIEELAKSVDRSDARKRIKGALKDLKDQARGYAAQRRNADSLPEVPVLGFEVHLHGGLDLFGRMGGCHGLSCRLAAADRVARSVGVFADHIWLTDSLTWDLVLWGRSTNARLDTIIDDGLVLARIWPLVQAGVVRFRPPVEVICEACALAAEDEISSVVRKVAPAFRNTFSLDASITGEFRLDTGDAFVPPVHFGRNFKGAPPTKAELVAEVLRGEVEAALYVARDAARFGGALFTNSRIGMAGLFAMDSASPMRRSRIRALLDRGDEFDLPWVSDLTPTQILELRDMAASAVPQLRELLARALAVRRIDDLAPSHDFSFVDDLREQSVAVRAELVDVSKRGAKYWKAAYGVLGLSASAFGLMNSTPGVALAGLLPIIQLLVNHKSGHEGDLDALLRKPAFVLVKAQDLLAHA